MLKILSREFVYLRFYFELQFVQIFRYWVLGIAIGSFISVFAKDRIHDLFRAMNGRKWGILGIIPACLLGIASPLCMYGTIPIAASFSRQGMREDWLASFMMASILLNPQLIIYSAALGPKVLAVRILSCFLCGIAAGLLLHRFYRGRLFFDFTGFEERASHDTHPNLLIRYLLNVWRNVKTTEPQAAEPGVAENAADTAAETDSSQNTQETPVIYFTDDISPEGLVSVYEALGWTPTGKVAVKLSTGEPPASNYLDPALIKDLVQSLDATIVECNTAYGGMRAATAEHYQVAEDHGFTEIADFQILDEDGYMEIPVTGGSRLTGDLVGAAFTDYDSYVILSHFKGHAMAGYGGAIKNSSIGLASSRGKVRIHSGGTSDTRWHDELHTEFLECMAEANKGVADYLGDRIIYINVLNRISIDCDCDGNPAEPDIHDIGIAASFDPVALDQACIDLVWDAEGSESLRARIEGLDGLHTLEYAEQIGLGSREYQLVNIE